MSNMKDAQSAPVRISDDVAVVGIKAKAKEDISKEARQFSALTLIKNARSYILAAREQEGTGDLRAAFASYIKAATLTRMTMDSPEYAQEIRDKGSVIRQELTDFLRNDGHDISARASAVEEKLKAIEKAHTAVYKVVPASVPNTARSLSISALKSSTLVDPPTSAPGPTLQLQHPISSTSTQSSGTSAKLTASKSNIAPAQNKNTDPSSTRKSRASSSETNAPKIYGVGNFPVKVAVCRDWKDGKCNYGQRCRFSHAIQAEAPNLENVQSTSNADGASGKPPTNPKGEKGKGRANDEQKETELQKRIEEEKQRREKVEKEKIERERAEKEEERKRAEKERVEREKAERETAEREKAKREKAEREKAEREKAEREKAEKERAEKERVEKERVEREAKERREAEARRRRDEAVQQRNEERKARLEAEKKRVQEIEQARLRNEERLAREKAAREAANREQTKIRREKEAAAIEQYIVSESNLITCSAGMNIQRIVSGFELCRITIKNLPIDARLEEIADIFTQQGVDTSEFFILQLKPNGTKREAIVLANIDQGQNVAVKLEGIEFRNEHLTFEVSTNASWNGMPTATQNEPFLTISWWAPSDTIIATYTSTEQAREQVERLNGKTWNGRRIEAMLDDHTAVKILGCAPGTAFSTEFCVFLKTFTVKLLSSANYDLGEVFTSIRHRLRYFSGAHMDTYEVLNNGQQIGAEARIRIGFNDWDDAKQAHDAMNNKRLRSNFPLLRCWLPDPLQYSIKITRQQYQAQKTQWDELSQRKPGRDAHVDTRIGDQGDVFIHVLGQDKRAVGSLKVRVEGMVAGEKLDAVHWHPSFAFPRGKFFLTSLFTEKQVYVRNDFKTRCLRVCGEPAKIEEAKQIIREEVERLAGMETTSILVAACVPGFMRKGLGKLKELIGEDNVTVNVASVPYKVTVKGGAEATHHLQRLMDESRAMGSVLNDALPRNAKRDICPICADNVSNPEQLGCGHTYCSGCLSHFLTSAAENKNFPLVCMESQCRIPIAIPFIRRFLSHQLFENLVEAAFMTYLEQHPKGFKYCTTPDCKQIYRRRTDRALLKCPACFTTICSTCDEEAHEGITCEERRIHLDPRLQERLNDELAREHGFKKCPQCSVYIEKIGGCNHIMCRCGAHICWICMDIFTADTIFPHLIAIHNGIFDPVPDGPHQRNAEVDENALMDVQIRGIERFEREQRAFEAMHVPQPVSPPVVRAIPGPRPVPPPVARAIPQSVPVNPIQLLLEMQRALEAAQLREEEAQAARRLEARRIRREERATQERVIRENQERAARLHAAQAAQAVQEQKAAEEKRRQEEAGWCVIM